MTKPRDFQIQKVYDWERKFFAHDTTIITLDEVKALAKLACAFYKCKAVGVTDGRGRSATACYSPGRHVIKMPTRFRKRWITLHEVAHAVVIYKLSKQSGVRYPSHGALFMAIYVTLIANFCQLRIEDILKDAKDYGLKVALEEVTTLEDVPLAA